MSYHPQGAPVMTDFEQSQAAMARLFSAAVRALFAPYPKALMGDTDSVHDVRVAARRLRVTLALLAADPEGKRRRRADRIVRGVARTLAVSRDLDVGVELFEHFLPPGEPARVAFDGLRRSLLAARARRRRQSREALLDLNVAKLRKDLRSFGAEGPVGVDAFRLRLTAWMEARGATVLGLIRPAGRQFEPEALHAARREARRLRYAAELADALLGRDGGARKVWRALQSEIGEIHDRHVFGGWLQSQQQRAARTGDMARERAARSMRARVLRDAGRLYREFLATDPTGRVHDALRAMRESAGG